MFVTGVLPAVYTAVQAVVLDTMERGCIRGPHDLPVGERARETIDAFIEISKGKRNKVEYDELATEPAFAGCVPAARPIGLLGTAGATGSDGKMLALPEQDPRLLEAYDLSDPPQHLLREAECFSRICRAPERKRMAVVGWHAVRRAHGVIADALQTFAARQERRALPFPQLLRVCVACPPIVGGKEEGVKTRHDMLAHGVNVVCAAHAGRRAGLAVAWATQVSADHVLICVGAQSATRELILASQAFGLSVLARDQVETARRFGCQSSRQVDKLSSTAYHTAQTGSPLLDDCRIALDCRVVQVHDFKREKLIIGHIVAAEQRRGDGEPLIYLEEDY